MCRAFDAVQLYSIQGEPGTRRPAKLGFRESREAVKHLVLTSSSLMLWCDLRNTVPQVLTPKRLLAEALLSRPKAQWRKPNSFP